MKKVLLSGTIILSFIVYAIINSKPMDVVTKSPVISDSVTVAQPTTAPVSGAQYKDGEYTGPVTDAFYGNIQVKATISGGKLTDVQFLQYPNDHHESIEINQRAMPLLKQEAIEAQNANVDIVTRATDTSNAFIQSLTDALNQAKS